jgi:phosphopantothenoylcysteine decarboxylase/phosphopantothenate--cysteine ligase
VARSRIIAHEHGGIGEDRRQLPQVQRAQAGDALAERAAAKLREKRCDAIVANDVSARGIGFGADENEVTLLFGDGARHVIARAPKRSVADSLWSLLAPRLPAREAADA